MVKTKMSVSGMMAQAHYRSIITLNNKFEDRGIGLQQIHYRYAFQNNPDIPEHYQKKMKKFFGSELKQLFVESDILEKAGIQRRIYRNCIKKGSHLSFFLKKLVDNDVFIRKKGEDGKYRYLLKRFYYMVSSVKTLTEIMKRVPLPVIMPMLEQFDDVGNLDAERGIMCNLNLLGVPETVFFRDNDKEKRELEQALNALNEAILNFLAYLKKTAPSNIHRGRVFSHTFGIYINGEIFNDKVMKELQKQSTIE